VLIFQKSSDKMNGRVPATRVADGPGDEVHKKKHTSLESSNTYGELKTTATIRRSRPSSIRPPKRNADKPIVKEISSSSELEQVAAIPRILTTFDMFGEKISVARPKVMENQPIPSGNHNFNPRPTLKKADAMANNENVVAHSKGWCLILFSFFLPSIRCQSYNKLARYFCYCGQLTILTGI
jgi:hypothetical protein